MTTSATPSRTSGARCCETRHIRRDPRKCVVGLGPCRMGRHGVRMGCGCGSKLSSPCCGLSLPIAPARETDPRADGEVGRFRYAALSMLRIMSVIGMLGWGRGRPAEAFHHRLGSQADRGEHRGEARSPTVGEGPSSVSRLTPAGQEREASSCSSAPCASHACWAGVVVPPSFRGWI